jgi:hypothetical protein
MCEHVVSSSGSYAVTYQLGATAVRKIEVWSRNLSPQ